MASSNNNDSGAGAAVGMIAAGVAALALLLFAFLAFLAFIMTFVALLAWNRPLRLGTWVVTPGEARGFVGRGIIGAVGVPAFAAFCEIVLQVPINWDYFVHMAVAGYTLGSIGVEIMTASDEAPSAPMTLLPPEPPRPLPPRQGLPAPEPQPFRYASWDDEEGR